MLFRYLRLTSRLPITFLLAALLLPVAGCATSSTETGSCRGQRLIVTTVSTSEASVPELHKILTEASGKPVHYMRTLFERHYLFCINGVADEEALAQLMADIKARPEIQAVELDRRRRISN
jgi:hypothetical protein